GLQIINEMGELARLPATAQRYIRRSLDIAFMRWDRLAEIARNSAEAKSIDRQTELYARLDSIRAAVPNGADAGQAGPFIAMAAELTAFDLGELKIRSFAAYRFLYERLLGAAARPWLLSLFVIGANLAQLNPGHRIELLKS